MFKSNRVLVVCETKDQYAFELGHLIPHEGIEVPGVCALFVQKHVPLSLICLDERRIVPVDPVVNHCHLKGRPREIVDHNHDEPWPASLNFHAPPLS